MKKIKQILLLIIFIINNWKSVIYGLYFVQREINKHTLTKLADKYKSDKGLRRHLYTRIYDELFQTRYKNIHSLLEIGLLLHEEQSIIRGKSYSMVPSLNMWTEYFPDADIYGFDLQDFSKAKGNWVKIIQGDQSDRESLSQIKDLNVLFDVIIDDALHASYHQQVSFSYLFSTLSPGGVYIIEDLDYQPAEYENKYTVEKTLYYLRILRDTGEWKSPVATSEEKEIVARNVDQIRFFDSINHGLRSNCALAIIFKK